MALFRIIVLSVVLFAVWLGFSGLFDAFHLSLGVLSVAIVVLWSQSLFPKDSEAPTSGLNPEILLRVRWKSFISYPFILLLNIITANLKVAAMILDPSMPIKPEIFSFKSTLKTDLAKIILGNAITLTPGTITLDIEEETFTVHSLSPTLATSLYSGVDQNRVAAIFGDPKQRNPVITLEVS